MRYIWLQMIVSKTALKQIKAVLDDLGNSPEPNLQEHSKKLLAKYFPSAKPRA
jgi:hypothetical protein